LNTFLIGAAICVRPFLEAGCLSMGVSLSCDITLTQVFGGHVRFGFAV
jgi:hypothetical protein